MFYVAVVISLILLVETAVSSMTQDMYFLIFRVKPAIFTAGCILVWIAAWYWIANFKKDDEEEY